MCGTVVTCIYAIAVYQIDREERKKKTREHRAARGTGG